MESPERTRRQSSRKRKAVDLYNPDVSTQISTENVLSKKSRQSKMTVLIADQLSPLPTRSKDGTLSFSDFPDFQPNMTPEEVIREGSFGGTYFRPISSSITGRSYTDEAWRELPQDWIKNLNIRKVVASPVYDINVNKYRQKCGQSLDAWETSGWITEADPYGWFQWYCRFYLGRRCSDDKRQVQRGLGVMGPKGRWRRNLVNKCLVSGKAPVDAVEDFNISPTIRQLLQHWAYKLTVKAIKK